MHREIAASPLVPRNDGLSSNSLNMKSCLITFEGVEGSGKTTQIKLLSQVLQDKGYQTLLTREPGGTNIGDDIRQILLDSQNKHMVPTCELFLYAAARAQHVEQVIQPALDAGKVVLCDRYMDASVAYQGYGRNFPLDLIHQLNKLAVGKAVPHLTCVLDCEPHMGVGRAKDRIANQDGPAEDRFENEPMKFHQKVREGYLALASQNPERIEVLDGNGSVEEVHQRIVDVVLKRL